SVAGHDIVTDPGGVRLRIGVALQEAALDLKQTGAEFLRLQGRLYGLKRGEIGQRLKDLGELIDLGDALDR
ncbi:MAG: daunorubicin ABC transporter ATP-binding protein, partial [Rubrobacteraceae bacterium]